MSGDSAPLWRVLVWFAAGLVVHDAVAVPAALLTDAVVGALLGFSVVTVVVAVLAVLLRRADPARPPTGPADRR